MKQPSIQSHSTPGVPAGCTVHATQVRTQPTLPPDHTLHSHGVHVAARRQPQRQREKHIARVRVQAAAAGFPSGPHEPGRPSLVNARVISFRRVAHTCGLGRRRVERPLVPAACPGRPAPVGPPPAASFVAAQRDHRGSSQPPAVSPSPPPFLDPPPLPPTRAPRTLSSCGRWSAGLGFLVRTLDWARHVRCRSDGGGAVPGRRIPHAEVLELGPVGDVTRGVGVRHTPAMVARGALLFRLESGTCPAGGQRTWRWVVGLGSGSVGDRSVHGQPRSLGLSATIQRYFSLRTNQPPTISQQYCSLRTNQHQPPAKRGESEVHRGTGGGAAEAVLLRMSVFFAKKERKMQRRMSRFAPSRCFQTHCKPAQRRAKSRKGVLW
jgi:hypothetical protein